MEQVNKKILFIAIALSLITTFLIFDYIKKIENKNPKIETVKVLVAVRTIEPRSTLTQQDIKEVEIDKSLLNPRAIRNIGEIVNKTTKDRIFEGEQILQDRLASKNSDTLSFEIPNGKRAVTVNVNEASAVGFFVQPGDYTDVIVTIDKDSQDGTPATSKTILQNVLVVGVGQERDVLDKVQQKTENKKISNAASNDTTTIKTITLAVLPEDVEKVALAEQIGTLKLSLRPAGEENNVNLSVLTKSTLIQ